MKLCYECRRVSPREAVFCAFCNRSFTNRICPRGHASPPDARCCIHCGAPATDLSQPTRLLNLSFLPVLISSCFVIGGGWLAWTLLQPTLTKTATATATSARLIFLHYFHISLLCFFLTFLIPGKYGEQVRRTAWRVLGQIVHLIASLLKNILYFVAFCFQRRR
jgi:hypothetical protein